MPNWLDNIFSIVQGTVGLTASSERGLAGFGLVASLWVVLLTIVRSSTGRRVIPDPRTTSIGIGLALAAEAASIAAISVDLVWAQGAGPLPAAIAPLAHALRSAGLVIVVAIHVWRVTADPQWRTKGTLLAAGIGAVAVVTAALWIPSMWSDPSSSATPAWPHAVLAVATIASLAWLMAASSAVPTFTRSSVRTAVSGFATAEAFLIAAVALPGLDGIGGIAHGLGVVSVLLLATTMFTEVTLGADRDLAKLEDRVSGLVQDLEESRKRLHAANNRLTESSALDPLTKVNNRRTFEDRLDVEWARARRSGEPITVMLIDIDGFRAINDQHGTPVGDTILLAVATELVVAAGRAGDAAARIGADEFVVLLPGTDRKGAETVAERIYSHLSELDLDDLSKPLRVTVAAVTAKVMGPEHVSQSLVLAAADAVAEAKERGGDQFVALDQRQPLIAGPG